MSNRKLAELGMHPAVGYILGAVAFVLISEYLFHKTDFAGYIIAFLAMGIMLRFSENRRSEFLLITFGNRKFRLIRLLENFVICLPFVVLLLFHNAWIESALLFAGSVTLASISFGNRLNFALPTPFYNKPFEFTSGFRSTFFIFPLAYILLVAAYLMDNFNLGIFGLIITYLITYSYYLQPENEYFIWSYSTSSSQFLLDKIKTATVYSSFLTLPFSIGLFVMYPSSALTILMFLLIGLAFLWAIVLAKYAAYPNEMNLPEGILLAICIYFPPLLTVVIPYFYSKALTKLNVLLKC